MFSLKYVHPYLGWNMINMIGEWTIYFSPAYPTSGDTCQYVTWCYMHNQLWFKHRLDYYFLVKFSSLVFYMGLCQNLEPTNAHEFTPVDLPIDLPIWSPDPSRTQGPKTFSKAIFLESPLSITFQGLFHVFHSNRQTSTSFWKFSPSLKKPRFPLQKKSGDGDEACSLSQTLRTPSRKFSKSIAVNCERKRRRWHEQSVGDSKTSMVIAIVI